MDYKKYQQSRDVAWEILIDFKIESMPVKISKIVTKLGIRLYSYHNATDLISKMRLEKHAETCDGFTVRTSKRYYIFYDDTCSPQRCRFTIAHELGHIMLGHLKNQTYTVKNREPSDDDSPEEQQANVFASRILSPACVLWGLHVDSADEIAKLCDISIESAAWRYDRLKLLYEREEEFKKKYGKSCFLLSPLEQKVFTQFQGYIKDLQGDF